MAQILGSGLGLEPTTSSCSNAASGRRTKVARSTIEPTSPHRLPPRAARASTTAALPARETYHLILSYRVIVSYLIDKIRLLGFTTLPDTRRYAIPQCWIPHTQTQRHGVLAMVKTPL